ncbi:hypothetical protein [Oceanisphaera sp. W20_SRM_FM3]|uniref:hypothetical protein n=1 Tax=Oceanisphaera sp. W20_SRM_FM3 TaxID=3240267 RepID=UPI003F94CB27
MKKFIIAPVAAVVMLGLSGAAFAGYNDGTGVDIDKEVDVALDMDYDGYAHIGGRIGVSQLGMAVIKNLQGTSDNTVVNFRNSNDANISGGSANGLAGNSGVNVAAGDNNVQANSTALTVLGVNDSPSAPGEGGGEGGEARKGGNYHHPVIWAKGASVDAEIGSSQISTENMVTNNGNHNNANVSGGSLNGAAGNLGANVAAGNGNVQANNFAVSYGEKANLAVSTVNNNQMTSNNTTYNNSLLDKHEVITTDVSLSGSANGTYNGTSSQSNNVYPQIWLGGTENGGHSGGGNKTYGGHIDFDNNGREPGKFEFADNGTIDLGTISLAGTVDTINYTVGRTNVNNANISGGSLNYASGNLGVNVAAGTNNLQSNSLALSVGNF